MLDMKNQNKPTGREWRRAEIFFLILLLALGLAYILSVVNFQIAADRQKTEIIPVSLNATRRANYLADPTRLARIAGVRLGLIQDAIFDQDPDADAPARFATVATNLLTPVVWILTPTPSWTPSRTPSPSSTRAPVDPWIAFGAWRVWCGTELSLPAVSALKLKFQMVGGGGKDGRVSYNCCGSTGVTWRVNNAWLSATDQIPWLNLGDTRESDNLGGGIVTQMHFNIGCNDKESADLAIYYLPAITPTVAPPIQNSATAQSMLTGTPIPVLSTTPASSILQTPTRIPTLTPLPTRTPTKISR
jgi:hypothetical protein